VSNFARYNNYTLSAENFPEFHRMFCEAMAELWNKDWERIQLEKIGEFTPAARIELNQRYQPIVDEASEALKVEFALRAQIAKRINSDNIYRAGMEEHFKNDPITFINCTMYTLDTRLSNIGLIPRIPLVLIKSQEEILYRVMDAQKNREGLMIEKSRAEGVTDILCAYSIYMWKYWEDYKVGWGSRKFEYVDKRGSTDSIFEKLRVKIKSLPSAIIPKGFLSNPKTNNKEGLLINPDTRSSILGEGGRSIGRGGKTGTYFVDEKAFLQFQDECDAALSNNTDCQVDITTPNGMNEFYEKKKRSPHRVYTCMWYKNWWKNKEWSTGKRPTDNAWYNCQLDKFGQDIVDQEINCSYEACVKDAFIPANWVASAIDFQLRGSGIIRAGYDTSAEGEDIATWGTAHGGKVTELRTVPGTTPYDKTKSVAPWNVEAEVNYFGYDKVSYGEDIYPQIKDMGIESDYVIKGIMGQSTPSDNIVSKDGKRAERKFGGI
jgi:hypothetical protein